MKISKWLETESSLQDVRMERDYVNTNIQRCK